MLFQLVFLKILVNRDLEGLDGCIAAYGVIRAHNSCSRKWKSVLSAPPPPPPFSPPLLPAHHARRRKTTSQGTSNCQSVAHLHLLTPLNFKALLLTAGRGTKRPQLGFF